MKAKKGNKVTVEYEGKLDNGEIFDSSNHGDHKHPLTFEIGAGQVIPKFEETVLTMEKGEEREIKIEAKEAYGEYHEELIRNLPKEILPKDKEPQKGDILRLTSPDGHLIFAKILEVKEKEIRVDLNHPLAGQNLTFKIKLINIF